MTVSTHTQHQEEWPLMLLRQFATIISLVLLVAAMSARAQDRLQTHSAVLAAFENERYEHALELIESYLADHPADAAMLYNGACGHARLDQDNLAAKFLLRAVKAGFKNFSHMQRDQDLKGLRDHPVFKALIDARAFADEMLADKTIDRWREVLQDDTYRIENDQSLRMKFVTSLDQRCDKSMRNQITRRMKYLREHLFAVSRKRYVVVIVPTLDDFRRILANPNAHGRYRHSRGELIVPGPGRGLNHEVVHIMHHNHMDTLGQQHPMWIQEGLACLYERLNWDHNDEVTYTPNERRNIVKSLNRSDQLMQWRSLFALSEQAFNADAGRHYAQAGSIFEFLHQHGKLQPWYNHYVEHFEGDPTGSASLMAVFGRELDDIEDAWREWIKEQPSVVTEQMLRER